MAVGRQDYQAGVVPIKSGYSLVQTQYFDWENKNVATGVTEDFCEYTPGAGYQLNVVGYRVFSTVPFVHLILIRVAGVQKTAFEFDTVIMDNFPEGATFVVDAGDEFKIQVKNQDSVTTKIYVMIYGYLEQIET